MLKVKQIGVLRDNYSYVLYNDDTGDALIIDPADETDKILDVLHDMNLCLRFILNTHHHYDHIGGNAVLKRVTGALVYASSINSFRIKDFDRPLDKIFKFGSHEIMVIDTPGHVKGHVSFFVPGIKSLFSGDVLFSGGCGRVFEGDVEELRHSLNILASLPGDVKLYCGHEYTLNNLLFAVTVDADNKELQDYLLAVRKKRSAGIPSVPSTILQEKMINPFLRYSDYYIKKKLQIEHGTDAEVFALLRCMKDAFVAM